MKLHGIPLSHFYNMAKHSLLEKAVFTETGNSIKTKVDIHISAIGGYQDELVKRDSEWLTIKCGPTE